MHASLWWVASVTAALSNPRHGTAARVRVTEDNRVLFRNGQQLRLSPSAAAAYQRCPLLFKLRHIDRIQEPATPELAAGSACTHAPTQRHRTTHAVHPNCLMVCVAQSWFMRPSPSSSSSRLHSARSLERRTSSVSAGGSSVSMAGTLLSLGCARARGPVWMQRGHTRRSSASARGA